MITTILVPPELQKGFNTTLKQLKKPLSLSAFNKFRTIQNNGYTFVLTKHDSKLYIFNWLDKNDSRTDTKLIKQPDWINGIECEIKDVKFITEIPPSDTTSYFDLSNPKEIKLVHPTQEPPQEKTELSLAIMCCHNVTKYGETHVEKRKTVESQRYLTAQDPDETAPIGTIFETQVENTTLSYAGIINPKNEKLNPSMYYELGTLFMGLSFTEKLKLCSAYCENLAKAPEKLKQILTSLSKEIPHYCKKLTPEIEQFFNFSLPTHQPSIQQIQNFLESLADYCEQNKKFFLVYKQEDEEHKSDPSLVGLKVLHMNLQNDMTTIKKLETKLKCLAKKQNFYTLNAPPYTMSHTLLGLKTNIRIPLSEFDTIEKTSAISKPRKKTYSFFGLKITLPTSLRNPPNKTTYNFNTDKHSVLSWDPTTKLMQSICKRLDNYLTYLEKQAEKNRGCSELTVKEEEQTEENSAYSQLNGKKELVENLLTRCLDFLTGIYSEKDQNTQQQKFMQLKNEFYQLKDRGVLAEHRNKIYRNLPFFSTLAPTKGASVMAICMRELEKIPSTANETAVYSAG